METEESPVPVAKKTYGKRAAAQKKSSTVTVLEESDNDSEDVVVADDDDDVFELQQKPAPATEKKRRGRKPAAQNAAKKQPAATGKRGGAGNKQSQILGQKFITDLLKPADESSGISPEKKVRKMRASPFNKKSGSLLAKVSNKDETESEELSGSAASASPGLDEVVEVAPAARARPQRANRTQTRRYVLSDTESDNEPDDYDEEDATEDSDYDD